MAKMSGTDIDNMGMAISKLSLLAVKSNSILGVSTKDMNGNVKDSGKLFEDLLLRISEIKNPTERLATSMQLFGRAGREVYEMASQGKGKLQELAKETESYGRILDEKTIISLERAKLATEKLDLAWKNLSGLEGKDRKRERCSCKDRTTLR